MGKLNQPHDKYFRATFGEVGFAKDFLSNYQDSSIASDLARVPGTFAD